MIDFTPVEPKHFALLLEWLQRPHVARWFAFWMPPTEEGTIELWTSMLEGRVPQRGYLVVVDGAPMGYVESSRVSEDPDWARTLGVDGEAVAADVFIADLDRIGQGLGASVVRRFYLWMMDETGLDVGIIDPEVDNLSAIRAYEKAGFSFLREVDSGQPRGREHIMRATRADLELALDGSS